MKIGSKHTEKTKKKMSLIRLGKNHPNWKGGLTLIKSYCILCNKLLGNLAYYNNTKKCKNCSKKSYGHPGKKHHNYKDGRTLKKYFCKCGKKIIYQTAIYGKGKCRDCDDKYHSLLFKALWKNKIFRNKTIKSQRLGLNKKNKKEIILESLLRKKYKFVGNGSLVIDGFNPDFISCNGQKKIIELYGDYWHSRPEVIERDKRRLEAYEKAGYKTLIIKENELNNVNNLKMKIYLFNKG